MDRRTKLATACTLTLTLALTVLNPVTAAALSEAERDAVIDELARELPDRYILPQRGEAIAEELLARRDEIGDTDDPVAFSMELSRLLYQISDDIHLRVSYRGGDQATDGPVRRVVRGPGGADGGEDGGPRIVRRPVGPGDGGEPSDGPRRRVVRGPGMMPGEGYRAEMLSGGIGLIGLDLLVPDEAAIRSAFETVAGAQALILDVRTCAGGSPMALGTMADYLFDEPITLVDHEVREPGADTTDRFSLVLEPVEGRLNMADVPLFVLTSGNSASGCEELSFDLKFHDRALIVGETTAGAGHGSTAMMAELGHGFSAFIPNMRPHHPAYVGGFEGTGVVPDVAVDEALALEQAKLLALELTGADAEAMAEAAAALAEGQIERARMAREGWDFVGVYENDTRISHHMGDLYFQRAGIRPLRLERAGEDLYSITHTPGQTIRFIRDGSGVVEALELAIPGGEPIRRERVESYYLGRM